jgi:hypothetical protein
MHAADLLDFGYVYGYCLMTNTISDEKKRIWIVTAEAVLVFILAVLTVHDTNTATGTGYLLYLEMEGLSREGWEVVVDAWVCLLVVLAAIIPSILYKTDHNGTGLFFMAGTSLLFLVRPDRLLTPFAGGEAIARSEAIYSLLSYLPAWMMTAVIIYALYHLPDTSEKESDSAEICACVSIVFMFLAVIFTRFFEILMFISGYVLLVPMARQIPKVKQGGRILAGTIFFLCSVWKLYSIMAGYHV